MTVVVEPDFTCGAVRVRVIVWMLGSRNVSAIDVGYFVDVYAIADGGQAIAVAEGYSAN